jgi:hypothetical protein
VSSRICLFLRSWGSGRCCKCFSREFRRSEERTGEMGVSSTTTASSTVCSDAMVEGYSVVWDQGCSCCAGERRKVRWGESLLPSSLVAGQPRAGSLHLATSKVRRVTLRLMSNKTHGRTDAAFVFLGRCRVTLFYTVPGHYRVHASSNVMPLAT